MAKNLPANAGDSGILSLILGLGRSPGEGNGNPLQYSCLENPMDGGARRATVHGVAGSRTTERLSMLAHNSPKTLAVWSVQKCPFQKYLPMYTPCDHNPEQDREHFRCPTRLLHDPSKIHPSFPTPQSRNHYSDCHHHSLFQPHLEHHVQLAPSVWLLSFTITHGRVIHVAAYTSSSSFSIAVELSIL